MRVIVLILFSFFLVSCKTEQLLLDAVWENPDYESKSFRKIAVFAIAKDEKNKKEFEKDAVKHFKSKKVIAIPGYKIFDNDSIADLDASEVKKRLYAQGFDGVLTAKTIEHISQDDHDTDEEELKRHSQDLYRFGHYFVSRYDHVQSDVQGNYTVLEANFYFLMDYNEFDGSSLAWISHYKIDPGTAKGNTEVEIDKYAHIVVQSLFDDQVILPRKAK